MARYWGRCFLLLLLTGAAGLWCAPARADHSLGRACLSCHALRSTSVVSGTRNILASQINYELYSNYWYCPQSSPTAFAGGTPLDCSYCHNGIATEFGDAGTTSSHPVYVLGQTGTPASPRVYCNDCHSPEVEPADLCAKGPSTGYPNHLNPSAVTDPTSTNRRVGAAAHLDNEYGPTAATDWTGSMATVLCMANCHEGTTGKGPNIREGYNAPQGGHNLIGLGSTLNRKLPCYDCHDPHASRDNAKLIVSMRADGHPNNPYETSYVTYDPPNGFDGANDRLVCLGCHAGTATVEGVTPADVLAAGWQPSVFPFHADAHADVTSTGNCLRQNGGCHQSAHVTDLFRCLDCHSAAVTAALGTPPTRLEEVHNPDSEFGHIGRVGVVTQQPANQIQSVHTIPYNATVWLPGDAFPSADAAVDMTDRNNNGCLFCHDTRGGSADTILMDDDGVFYTGSRGQSYTGAGDPRRRLADFNPFCLSCHDGDTVGDPTNPTVFAVPRNYILSDDNEPNGQQVVYDTNDLNPLYPPQVDNKQPPSTNGYYYDAGHGRGLGGLSGDYPSGLASPTTENAAAEVPCLECHLYHGSTAYKLLPGWRESFDGIARVVRGRAYPLKPSGEPATGIANSIGGIRYSTAIDYTDYSSPDYARVVSDYRENAYWSSYGSGGTPAGMNTPYGTSGNVFDLSCTSSWDADSIIGYSATGTKEIGFCFTCHLSDATNDGTTTTYDTAFTHEGSTTAIDCGGNDWGSKRNFARDCMDCHDPHGSGPDSTSGTPNIFMVRQRIKHPTNDPPTNFAWDAVNFTSRTGANSFDEDTTDNLDDLCNVCHVALDHSNQTNLAPDPHFVGYQCTATCHTHQD